MIILKQEVLNLIEKTLNIKRSGICNCCNGKIKNSGGFIWKYIKS